MDALTWLRSCSEKQHKTQQKKWNLDNKYIKAFEYMFMIKTMRERQAETPPKETRFILRGRVVYPKSIARFEKRAQKKGTLKEGGPIKCDGEPFMVKCPDDSIWMLTCLFRSQNPSKTWSTARRPQRRPPITKRPMPKCTRPTSVCTALSHSIPWRSLLLTLSSLAH
jgi:hypothetical protein